MSKPGFDWMTPVLCVNDLASSLRHYEQVLGFEVSWKWSDTDAFDDTDEPTFACVCRGDCSIFLCQQGQGKPGAWICFNVCTLEELEQVYQEYRASSADIVEAPVDCPWGMREMLVRDPDGNTFRIGCHLE